MNLVQERVNAIAQQKAIEAKQEADKLAEKIEFAKNLLRPHFEKAIKDIIDSLSDDEVLETVRVANIKGGCISKPYRASLLIDPAIEAGIYEVDGSNHYSNLFSHKFRDKVFIEICEEFGAKFLTDLLPRAARGANEGGDTFVIEFALKG